MIYDKITANCSIGKKMLSVLIDPDKYSENSLLELIQEINNTQPDFIFVGGSLTSESSEKTIEIIKQQCTIPVVSFPGNATQFSAKADALLFLSLISGRNADYLIGQQVVAAPLIYKSNIETISVGYMLIESGARTSVEYITNTIPIPAEKTDIAVATALAGQMIGNKMIYLEGGSGAKHHVSADMIKAVKKHISIPLIVGGGLRTSKDINDVLSAGADMIIIGNILEKNKSLMKEFVAITHNFK